MLHTLNEMNHTANVSRRASEPAASLLSSSLLSSSLLFPPLFCLEELIIGKQALFQNYIVPIPCAIN
jgi:hypothetical protein